MGYDVAASTLVRMPSPEHLARAKAEHRKENNRRKRAGEAQVSFNVWTVERILNGLGEHGRVITQPRQAARDA